MTRRLARAVALVAALALTPALVRCAPEPAAADHSGYETAVGGGHWSTAHGPLTVCVTDKRLERDTRDVARLWVDAGFPLGFTYRGVCSSMDAADVAVRWAPDGYPYEGTNGSSYLPDGHIGDCDITTQRRNQGGTHHILLHELGHCLGLGHSADPTSVMGGASTIGPHDLEALAATYVPHTEPPPPV